MAADSVASVRTLALVGDTGVGKTALAEALLFATGAIKARGSVERGTTVTDFDPQEKDGGHSIATAAAHFTWRGVAVDLLDTPGLPDFAGQSQPAPGIFLPAIEKGVRQALATGVVAGYEVVDVRVTVFDGKTHPVDGKEIAFTTAGRKAFLEAFTAAKPILLGPIVNVDIVVPGTYMGDIASDLATRRGQVSGTESVGPEMYRVSGVVPQAEVTDYSSRLKSITGGSEIGRAHV